MTRSVFGRLRGKITGSTRQGAPLFLVLSLPLAPVSWADELPKAGEKRIGLALSGGGYRAAAFHLGVMRKLDELGILDRVDRMSCVSGGSIAGAVVALQWDQPNRLDILEDYLRTKSVAISSVLRGLLDPFESRIEKLAAAYDRHLFDEKPLAAIQATLQASGGPELYLNATNLATGNMFSFVVAEKVRMKDWELRPVDASNFPIAKAVAASSAFPPIYNPLRLNGSDFRPKKKGATPPKYLSLTDGGVYDNLGVNPLVVRGRGAVDYVIISDGGMPFKFKSKPTRSSLKTLKVALGIYKDQVVRHQIGNAKRRVSTALWFAIDDRLKKGVSGDEVETVKIDTDLKALNIQDMSVLTRHGENLVERRICRWAPEMIRDINKRRSTCRFVDKLIDYLEGRRGQPASTSEIANSIGKSKMLRKVEYLLARLAEDGAVGRTGSKEAEYFVGESRTD